VIPTAQSLAAELEVLVKCNDFNASVAVWLQRSIMAPIVTFGELLVDFVPTVAGLSLSDAPAFEKAAGGAPANVAVGVCKLGGQAAHIGKVAFLNSPEISQTEYKI